MPDETNTVEKGRAKFSFLWIAIGLFVVGIAAYMVVQRREVPETREALMARAAQANAVATVILGVGLVVAVIGLVKERTRRAAWLVTLFLYVILPVLVVGWLVFFAAPVAPVSIRSP